MLIDAHIHLWSQDPDKYPWSPIGGYIPEKSAPIEDFLRLMDQTGVDRVVVVQPTSYGWDNSYIMDACSVEGDRFKKVVLVNPVSPFASDDLMKLVEKGADGLRINLHLQPIEKWKNDKYFSLIDAAQTLEIPICFQLTPDYFPLVRSLAIRFESINIVLDHLGRPRKGCCLEDKSFDELLKLAEYKNIFVKLSGLNYFSEETKPYRDTWPLLHAAKEAYSEKRCMWGSDYPFVNDHWSYEEDLDCFKKGLGFSESDLEWILGRTAETIWWSV